MDLQAKRRIVWIVIIAAYFASWLPNFGIFNSLTWVGPFSLPLAWVLLMNIVLTIGVFLVHTYHFKPFVERLKHDPIEREVE
jgi:fatty acid desaturase